LTPHWLFGKETSLERISEAVLEFIEKKRNGKTIKLIRILSDTPDKEVLGYRGLFRIENNEYEVHIRHKKTGKTEMSIKSGIVNKICLGMVIITGILAGITALIIAGLRTFTALGTFIAAFLLFGLIFILNKNKGYEFEKRERFMQEIITFTVNKVSNYPP
jgi:hypothetical protein